MIQRKKISKNIDRCPEYATRHATNIAIATCNMNGDVNQCNNNANYKDLLNWS